MQNYFVLYFFLLLILSFLFVKVFKKFLFFLNIRRLFPVLYLSVHIHEVLHFIMALITLKWPKYHGVKITRTKKGFLMKGGVSVKVYSYKELIHNIMRGQFVIEGLFLIHQLLSSFFIALAPIIFPYLLLYYFFRVQGIDFIDFDVLVSIGKIPIWHLLLLVPISFFGALVASPSKEDIKIALPLLIALFFIPVPTELNNFVIFTSFLLLLGIIFILLIWFIYYLLRSIRY